MDGHEASPSCPRCYRGYPLRCRCGGLVHATHLGQVDDDPNEDDVDFLCDTCDDWYLAEWVTANMCQGQSPGWITVADMLDPPGTSSAADVVRRLGLDPNAEPLEIIDPPAMVDLETLLAGVTDEHLPRPCAWCGQQHERGSGQCACWSDPA